MTQKPLFLVGLDYELFFGPRSGSVENCMIAPSAAIAKLAEARSSRLTFFVDAGMLVKMRQLAGGNVTIQRDYDAVRRNLEYLVARGHDLQLHIHPHWETARYHGSRWIFDYRAYRLHTFSPGDIDQIVRDYSGAVAVISGRKPDTFRAGGFCLQPFNQIAEALANHGIRVDSSIIPESFQRDPVRFHDFRNAPKKCCWQFDDDPLVETARGRFLEVPITPVTVRFDFYWRYLLSRKLAGRRHQSFGDGGSLSAGVRNYLRKLSTFGELMEASVDGYKSTQLFKALRNTECRNPAILNIMGHPKALSRYSLERFDRFLDRTGLHSISFSDGRLWGLA